MEVITKGLPNDNQVLLDEATISYVQNPDCTEDRDGDWQKLTLSIRDNGMDKFLNIKTDNWSFDNAEMISVIIDDFCKRIGYENTNNF
ncbi:MAG: hypothetical protein VZS44_07520 [Bacilli bacterium]|nr:hypothetical protein [Bacilli bacterium]